MPAQQSRSFVFTDFFRYDAHEVDLDGQVTQIPARDPREVYEAMMRKHGIRFMAFEAETCGRTGRRHMQGYMYFIKPKATGTRSLAKIAKCFIQPAHIEPMRGSFKDNEIYCAKENGLIKLGDEPRQGARGDLQETLDAIGRGEMTADEVAVENGAFFHQYGRTMREVEAITLRKRWRTEMTEGIWYFGDTGAGKSHRAFEGFDPETTYVRETEDGKWWDGYKGQPTVILNEFRGGLPYGELLSLVDKWPKKVSWRCREPVPFLAKRLVVTSRHPPEAIYKNVDNDGHAQLYRRFKVYRLTGPDHEPVPWDLAGVDPDDY